MKTCIATKKKKEYIMIPNKNKKFKSDFSFSLLLSLLDIYFYVQNYLNNY